MQFRFYTTIGSGLRNMSSPHIICSIYSLTRIGLNKTEEYSSVVGTADRAYLQITAVEEPDAKDPLRIVFLYL